MRHFPAAIAALCLLAAAPAARAADHAANSIPTLEAALKAAQSGDRILLAPGVYSTVTLKYLTLSPAELRFDPPVTITSADPARPAQISVMRINRVHGLTFTGLEFVSIPGLFSHEIKNCSRITLDRNHFHGSLDGDSSNDGSGISFAWCSDVKVTNNEFQQLLRGVSFGATKNVLLQGNSFHDIRSDGANFSQVNFVDVRGNDFRSFRAVGTDHPDAIQFWTSNTTTPSTDILIAENLAEKGEGAGMQAFFLRDQLLTLPYERVTIRDNLAVDTGYNGIRIQGAKDVKVIGNELITIAPLDGTKPQTTFMLVQRGDGVFSQNNRAAAISFDIGKPDASINVVQDGDVVTQMMTAEQTAEAKAAWLAKFRAPAPEPDPRDARIATLEAQVATLSGRIEALSDQLATVGAETTALTARVDRLLAERAKSLAASQVGLDLALNARAARAKNQYLDPLIPVLRDQLVTPLSAAAP